MTGSVEARPKIDLHRHLLGSARPSTLWEFAKSYGLEEGNLSIGEFTKKLVRRKPAQDLADYISAWDLYRNAIRTPEDVHRVTKEAAADAKADGVRYVEFRSSLPGLPVRDGTAPQTQI